MNTNVPPSIAYLSTYEQLCSMLLKWIRTELNIANNNKVDSNDSTTPLPIESLILLESGILMNMGDFAEKYPMIHNRLNILYVNILTAFGKDYVNTIAEIMSVQRDIKQLVPSTYDYMIFLPIMNYIYMDEITNVNVVKYGPNINTLPQQGLRY